MRAPLDSLAHGPRVRQCATQRTLERGVNHRKHLVTHDRELWREVHVGSVLVERVQLGVDVAHTPELGQAHGEDEVVDMWHAVGVPACLPVQVETEHQPAVAEVETQNVFQSLLTTKDGVVLMWS